MHYAAIQFHIGAEMDFFSLLLTRTDIISVLNLTRNNPSHHPRWDERSFIFSARRTVLNCKASVMHNVAIELQIGPEIAIFNFFLAKTDIISVLNLTRNSPSHHRRFRWDENCFIFFLPAELSWTVKLLLRIMHRSNFRSDRKWTFFASVWLGPTFFSS